MLRAPCFNILVEPAARSQSKRDASVLVSTIISNDSFDSLILSIVGDPAVPRDSYLPDHLAYLDVLLKQSHSRHAGGSAYFA